MCADDILDALDLEVSSSPAPLSALEIVIRARDYLYSRLLDLTAAADEGFEVLSRSPRAAKSARGPSDWWIICRFCAAFESRLRTLLARSSGRRLRAEEIAPVVARARNAFRKEVRRSRLSRGNRADGAMLAAGRFVDVAPCGNWRTCFAGRPGRAPPSRALVNDVFEAPRGASPRPCGP